MSGYTDDFMKEVLQLVSGAGVPHLNNPEKSLRSEAIYLKHSTPQSLVSQTRVASHDNGMPSITFDPRRGDKPADAANYVIGAYNKIPDLIKPDIHKYWEGQNKKDEFQILLSRINDFVQKAQFADGRLKKTRQDRALIDSLGGEDFFKKHRFDGHSFDYPYRPYEERATSFFEKQNNAIAHGDDPWWTKRFGDMRKDFEYFKNDMPIASAPARPTGAFTFDDLYNLMDKLGIKKDD